jgi:hypothetical protein
LPCWAGRPLSPRPWLPCGRGESVRDDLLKRGIRPEHQEVIVTGYLRRERSIQIYSSRNGLNGRIGVSKP